MTIKLIIFKFSYHILKYIYKLCISLYVKIFLTSQLFILWRHAGITDGEGRMMRWRTESTMQDLKKSDIRHRLPGICLFVYFIFIIKMQDLKKSGILLQLPGICLFICLFNNNNQNAEFKKIRYPASIAR